MHNNACLCFTGQIHFILFFYHPIYHLMQIRGHRLGSNSPYLARYMFYLLFQHSVNDEVVFHIDMPHPLAVYPQKPGRGRRSRLEWFNCFWRYRTPFTVSAKAIYSTSKDDNATTCYIIENRVIEAPASFIAPLDTEHLPCYLGKRRDQSRHMRTSRVRPLVLLPTWVLGPASGQGTEVYIYIYNSVSSN